MDSPSGTGLSIPALGSLATQTVPFNLYVASFSFASSCLWVPGLAVSGPPTLLCGSGFLLPSLLLRGACSLESLLAGLLTTYPGGNNCGARGSPVESGSWGSLVPEPG